MKNLLLILSLVFAPYALADFVPGGTGSPATFSSGANFSGAVTIDSNPVQTITDWVSFTPAWTNMPTLSTNEGKWRRVGDTMEIMIVVIASANGSGGSAVFNIPNSLTMDVSKIPNGSNPTSANKGNLGFGNWNDAGGGTHSILGVTNNNTTNEIAFGRIDNVVGGFFTGALVGSGDYFMLKLAVPILEWD